MPILKLKKKKKQQQQFNKIEMKPKKKKKKKKLLKLERLKSLVVGKIITIRYFFDEDQQCYKPKIQQNTQKEKRTNRKAEYKGHNRFVSGSRY